MQKKALQPRGPSMSSMMVIVTMVTAAATMAAACEKMEAIERGPATKWYTGPG